MRIEIVPISKLYQSPDNANNGDLDAIGESIEVNGFYSPIIVQRSTNYILAGNHRYVAAIAQGAVVIPAIYLDVDEKQAKRIMVADNRTTRLGFDDDSQLLNVLEDLYATDVGLAGTGYEYEDYAKLAAELNGPLDFDAEPVEADRERKSDGPSKAMRFSIQPVVDEDGNCTEIVLQKEGMGPITKTDANAIRRALGMEPFTKTELQALEVPSWR